MTSKYNEKHGTKFSISYSPKIECNNGDLVPHTQKVFELSFFREIRLNELDLYEKIILPRDFILDLAKQIEEIEKEEIEMVYDTLPF